MLKNYINKNTELDTLFFCVLIDIQVGAGEK